MPSQLAIYDMVIAVPRDEHAPVCVLKLQRINRLHAPDYQPYARRDHHDAERAKARVEQEYETTCEWLREADYLHRDALPWPKEPGLYIVRLRCTWTQWVTMDGTEYDEDARIVRTSGPHYFRVPDVNDFVSGEIVNKRLLRKLAARGLGFGHWSSNDIWPHERSHYAALKLRTYRAPIENVRRWREEESLFGALTTMKGFYNPFRPEVRPDAHLATAASVLEAHEVIQAANA